MRTPLRQTKIARGKRGQSFSYPSPIGGWNARDALADMPQTDAVELENWFPGTSYCEMRGGYSDHATGMAHAGKTLMTYNGLDGTNSMWCVTEDGVYDVTSAGAVGATVIARTNAKHQWLQFGDGTSNWLIAANGVDKPLYYDGTTWTAVDNVTTPALTGLTTTEIISLFASKGRLYFIEKDSLSFWYLPAGVAGGALLEFDLSGVARMGGFLMAGATWTVDGGDGPDDRVVFITSQGEVIVYQGDNPSSASFWQLVGVYNLGKPLGRRCVTRYGGDVIVLTQNGAFPLSAAIQSAAINYSTALSFKIQNAFTEAARDYGSTFGWIPIVYPDQSALIVNIPISENGEHEQYVMNTITKAWCKFTEWDAEDFVIFNSKLYFVTSTKVVLAWYLHVDGTADISAYGKQAFSYFGAPGTLKKFTLYRPVLSTNGSITFATDIDIDFQEHELSGNTSASSLAFARWDRSYWDIGLWGNSQEIVKQWTSPAEWQGYAAAGKVQVSTNALTIQWMANDIVWESGGIV
ncbi:MAG: hypothetical protein ITD33_00030 [Nitrosarchaeum sp.]|nr:hypothetical protein [Nitrosarchaeum sp.]